jgi:hypothetical protein
VYTNMVAIPVSGFWKYWTQKLALLKSECHAITYKYVEAASVVQQVHRSTHYHYHYHLLFTSINPIRSTNSHGCGNHLGYKLVQGATCRTIIEH